MVESLSDFLDVFDRGGREDDSDDSRRPTTYQPYALGVGVRMELSDNYFVGNQEIVRFGNDFFMVVNEHKMINDFAEENSIDGWMIFHFRVSGNTR